MKVVSALFIFIMSWGYLAMAQVAPAVSPAASAAPVVAAVVSAPPAAQTGVMAWVESHGGFQGAVLLLMFSALTLLSALRTVVLKIENLMPDGSNIPDNQKWLKVLNVVVSWLGKVMDWAMGNVAH